jgi:hypothetical protein
VPEIYESSSEESHSTGGTWGERSSAAFTNQNYVYSNESFLTDKESIPVRFNTNGRHSPIFSTKMWLANYFLVIVFIHFDIIKRFTSSCDTVTYAIQEKRGGV